MEDNEWLENQFKKKMTQTEIETETESMRPLGRAGGNRLTSLGSP